MRIKELINRNRKKNKFYTGFLGDTYANWQILDNAQLYLQVVGDDVRQLNELMPKTIFHAYWHGDFGAKQAFSIKSFLCTQDLENSELYLWLDSENGYKTAEDNPYIQQFSGKIHVLEADMKSLIQGTLFQQIQSSICTEKPLPFKADDFRIIVLNLYGGVWFDLDIMFLKDFTPLLKGPEFVYCWEFQPFANNALVYLRKGSFLNGVVSKKMITKKNAQPWVLFNYADKKLSSLMLYPSCYFDPLWQGYVEGMPFSDFIYFFKPFDEVFQKKDLIKSYKDFFKGDYAYHWHNQWGEPIVENSYFGMFDKEFSRELD